jgi:1-acyl-sn-glycerol-3-phosphate acyltransferase
MWSVIRRVYATIVFWFAVATGVILAALATLLQPFTWCHDGIADNIRSYTASTIFFVMTRTGIWKVRTTGLQKLSLTQAVVLAGNHQSIIDTLFMCLLPTTRKTYTYNRKWMWVPVFGWMCWLAGFTDIDKSSRTALSKIVDRVTDRVRVGYTVMIYPEGTRNKQSVVTSLMDTIKTGAFRIAQNARVPLQPIAFRGTNVACRGFVADYATIKIDICDAYDIPSDMLIGRAIREFRDQIDPILSS